MAATSHSSDLLSASAGVGGGRQLLNSLQVNTDGVNAATVTIYDNTAASGKVLCQLKVPGATLSQTIVFTFPLYAEIGLYCAISGTGAQAIVGFGAA